MGNEIVMTLVGGLVEWYDLISALEQDKQSQTLAMQVAAKLGDKLRLSTREEEALGRLRSAVKNADRWSPDLLRNNIFKAAHSLGLKLPSAMFASVQDRQLESEWGPCLDKTAAQEYAWYKGRKYRLLWQGRTKYGDKAHLAFMDMSKTFWVPLEALGSAPVVPVGRIDVTKIKPAPQDSNTCEVDWPKSGCCPVCHGRHRYVPCGYPGCNPNYCDECNGGGRYCRA